MRVHILFQPEDLQTSPPSTVLEKLNAQLFEQFAANEFATFFIGVIDLDKNTLDYAVAASTESLVLNREADEVRHLEQAGLPAGATANATYETHSVAFNEGDTLMIYSDALIETTTKDSGTFLPISEVTDVFKRHMRSRSAPAKQLQERALYETLGRIGANEDDVPLNDDLPLALLTRVSN